MGPLQNSVSALTFVLVAYITKNTKRGSNVFSKALSKKRKSFPPTHYKRAWEQGAGKHSIGSKEQTKTAAPAEIKKIAALPRAARTIAERANAESADKGRTNAPLFKAPIEPGLLQRCRTRL